MIMVYSEIVIHDIKWEGKFLVIPLFDCQIMISLFILNK